MTKYNNEEATISELGNWNVASDFVREKIMKPLIKCDLYEDLAEYGRESIAEEIYYWNSPPDDYIKINGFKRLVSELMRLINNSKFALKKKGTKTEILQYLNELQQIKDKFPLFIKITMNHVEKTRKISIKNLEDYYKLLDIVKKIKSKINEPLNKNHLIFVDQEEFDPQAYKEQVIKNATTRG